MWAWEWHIARKFSLTLVNSQDGLWYSDCVLLMSTSYKSHVHFISLVYCWEEMHSQLCFKMMQQIWNIQVFDLFHFLLSLQSILVVNTVQFLWTQNLWKLINFKWVFSKVLAHVHIITCFYQVTRSCVLRNDTNLTCIAPDSSTAANESWVPEEEYYITSASECRSCDSHVQCHACVNVSVAMIWLGTVAW